MLPRRHALLLVLCLGPALRAGEPYRISRALAWEAVLVSIEGGSAGLEHAAVITTRSMDTSSVSATTTS